MPPDWRLREATPHDIEAIAAVHLASHRSAYRGLVPDPILDALTGADYEAAWRRTLETLDAPWLAVDDRDEVLGFALVGRARALDVPSATGEVRSIHLRPEHIGTGLGRALFGQAVETLRRLDFLEAVLWVLDGNARARRFYERAGWQPDGTRRERTFEAGPHRALVPEVRYRGALAPR